MKTDNEMTRAILDEVKTRKAKRKRRVTLGASVLTLALLLTGAITAQQLGLLPPRAKGEPDTGTTAATAGQPETSATLIESSDFVPESAPAVGTQTATTNGLDPQITTTANCTTTPPDVAEITTQGYSTAQPPKNESGGDGYGGNIGGVRIPALPQDRTIQYTGEAITDAEAAAYFRENTWLQSALAGSGVDADGMRYADHGYCHVSYDGTEGKPFEMHRNFRDYLVWNSKGELIAIVTLTKENGALSATPAFGGPWFADYNAFLRRHKGETLVFVYAGWAELVLTPDGGVYNPQGTDVSRYLEGVENPYAIFQCDAASYVP